METVFCVNHHHPLLSSPHTHLTTWLDSDSICSRDTSRSAVDGTPSSSICGGCGWARRFRVAAARRARAKTARAASPPNPRLVHPPPASARAGWSPVHAWRDEGASSGVRGRRGRRKRGGARAHSPSLPPTLTSSRVFLRATRRPVAFSRALYTCVWGGGGLKRVSACPHCDALSQILTGRARAPLSRPHLAVRPLPNLLQLFVGVHEEAARSVGWGGSCEEGRVCLDARKKRFREWLGFARERVFCEAGGSPPTKSKPTRRHHLRPNRVERAKKQGLRRTHNHLIIKSSTKCCPPAPPPPPAPLSPLHTSPFDHTAGRPSCLPLPGRLLGQTRPGCRRRRHPSTQG